MAKRLAGRFGYPEAPHEFDVTVHEDRLDQPLHWKKPRTVFVVSMGDLFHEDVFMATISKVFRRMLFAKQHTFLLLTKRPASMKGYLDSSVWDGQWHGFGFEHPYPAPNIWLGVTAENQRCADERIPILLNTPAVVRFVSVEPMLSPVDVWDYLPQYDYRPTYAYWRAAFPDVGDQPILERKGLSWCIVGGETGPGARSMDPRWARNVLEQCRTAGVPFFMKQMSNRAPIPPDLLVREWPNEVE